ncbi:MAG: cyclic nucleotide-binding domain-containing protein [Candidatus Ancaeobacter aquaticus]|nr:cyclic nucleotide-binding domain-containing protein [Candidatus Ancaeobacter aquaticus]
MTEEKNNNQKKSFWTILAEHVDFSLFKFLKESTIEEVSFTPRRGEKYHIIKNPKEVKYLRLSDKDHFIFEQLDGKNTVSEIVYAYFMKYKALAFERVAGLIEELYSSHFLTAKPVNVFKKLKNYFDRKTLIHWMNGLKEWFFQKTFPINNIDNILTKMYKGGVWLFFTRFAKVSYVILSIVGTLMFITNIVPSDQYHILKSGDSYAVGFFTFLMISIVVIFIHEGAHAFTVKSYGRSVPKGGFLFYFGAPCFYAETSDIWMESKTRRIAVSWAGPYAELVIASTLSIILSLWPASPLSDVLFKATIFCYLGVVLNLDPLLEFDGYFMLMDWLEIPLLRKKAIDFVKKDLFKKVVHKETFEREEKIYTVFGIFSIVWTAIAITIAVLFLKMRFFQILSEFVTGDSIGIKIFSFIFFVCIVVPLALSLLCFVLLSLRRLWRIIIARGVLQNPLSIIATCVPLGCFVIFLPEILYGYTTPQYLSGMYILLGLISFYFSCKACVNLHKPLQGLPLVFLSLYPILQGLMVYVPVTWVTPLHLLTLLLIVIALSMFFYNAFIAKNGITIRVFYCVAVMGSLCVVLYYKMCCFNPLLLGTDCLSYGSIILCIVGAVLLLNVFGKKIFYVYLLFSGALLMLAAGCNEQVNHFAIPLTSLFVTVGIYIYYVTACGVKNVVMQYDPVTGNDEERFSQGFSVLLGNVIKGIGEMSGITNERYLKSIIADNKRINNEGEVQALKGVSQVSKQCVGQGEALLKSSTKLVGDTLVKKLLYGTLETMYWEDREVVNHYFTRLVKDAHGIAYEKRYLKDDPEEILKQNELFKNLPHEELQYLVNRFRAERYSDNYDVIKQGDKGDKFYVVKTGTVDVIYNDSVQGEKVLATLKRGDYFGEIALLKDVPRTATVRSSSPVTLLSLSKSDFNHLVKKYFSLIKNIHKGIGARKERIDIISVIPLFAEFSYQQLALISLRMKEAEFDKGACIVSQGEVGDKFYIIQEGEVDVAVQDETGEIKNISTLYDGDYFGEIALILKVARTASVTARKKTKVFQLEKNDFDEMIKKHLFANKNLEQVATRRLYNVNKQKT